MRLQLAILSGSIKKEKIIKNEKRCRVGVRRNIKKERENIEVKVIVQSSIPTFFHDRIYRCGNGLSGHGLVLRFYEAVKAWT